MFCPIYEPRLTIDLQWDDDTGQWIRVKKPAGWYPWVPFHFQVEMIHWIQRVLDLTELEDVTGKGDGVVEKSREMGASWLFCLVAAHGFLFEESYEVGFISYKEEVVDKKGSSKSLFYKLRALIGWFDKVPRKSNAPGTMWHDLPTRVPDFITPSGLITKEHDQTNQLLHPTKNNALRGNSTSSKTGLGDRLAWILIDESAKNENLLNIWGGLQGTTYHRFANSSADLRFGDDFFRLARNAEDATTFQRNGPSFLKLPWYIQPLRGEGWLESERARSDLDPHQFAREYEIDYHAGFGDWVYPFAQQMTTSPAPYVLGAGPVAGSIDPSVSDPTALCLWQKDAGRRRTRLFDALHFKTPSAAMLAPILMGFPIGHPEFDACPAEARDFMRTMWEFRERNEPMEWVGDPYGNAGGGASSETFYQAVHRVSVELSAQYPDLPERIITIRYNYDNNARYHPGRKEALSGLLSSLDINDSPGGRTFLEALQSHRYKAEDKATAERLTPEHGWGSHLTTAAEFYAVHDRALTDALSFRHRAVPGPHSFPMTSNRRPQKPRRVA